MVKRALEVGATGIILVHNHPSGSHQPSQGDIDATRRIVDAASIDGHLRARPYRHLARRLGELPMLGLLESPARRTERFRDEPRAATCRAGGTKGSHHWPGGQGRPALRRPARRGQFRNCPPQPICCPVFSQSARKALMPLSVSGCLNSWRITAGGAVITSAPSLAASRTWIGWRMLAARIWVAKS